MDTGLYEGHVAYVSAVHADGTITVREANFTPSVVGTRTQTPAAMKVLGYFSPGGGRPDLGAVKKVMTPNARTESHIASESSAFQQYVFNASTAQPVEDQYAYEFESADWDGDRRPDLVAIKKSGTSGGRAEVHIASGAGNFQFYLLNVATPLAVEDLNNYDFELADWDRDGRPDLIVVKKRFTSNGTAEVYVLSGASNFQQYALSVSTPQPVEDVNGYEFEAADWDRDGKPDLFVIKKSGTPSGRAEVHVLSGRATSSSTF